MAANNVLDKEVPIYHRFVDNQVLTDDQLNEVLDHLNFQDKLTRTGLVGVGIVCGLKLKATANTINLSKGLAVTTDGDLLKKEATTFRGFKKFKDENVKYGHFLDGDKVIDLYELEEDNAPSDVTPLNKFQSSTGISNDRMVALFYLENFLKEEEDCSPVDCNAQGREVVNNLRVLVTSIDLAKKVAEKDSIFSGLLSSSHNEVLNKINTYLPKRIIINSGTAASISSLRNAYAVEFDGLFNRISQLGEMNIFKTLSNNSGFDLNQPISKLKAQDLNFQYIYDFYKDLATAYNELLTALQHQYTICCPNPSAFPKHIFLGEVHNEPAYLRHAFYPSPIHDNNKSILHLQRLFDRIMQMIKHFLISSKNELRITPSRNNKYALGKRALPYYYDLSKADDPKLMLNSWGVNEESDVLNYYKAAYPSSGFEPLDYCLDEHDFYRIEGHVGRDVTSVVKDLQNIRSQKGLPFDIMPIAVGVAADDVTLDYDKYSMYFEDLQVILQAWNEEQKCMISGSSKFLTRFSAKEKGVHLDYAVIADLAIPATDTSVQPSQPLSGAQPLGLGFAVEHSPLLGITKGATASKKRSSRSKTNTVMTNMDVSSDSLGGIYVKGLEASDGGSDFQVKIDNAVKETIKNWEPEIQIAVAEIPSDLLGKLKVSEDNKLVDIEDFTEENLDKYIKALEEQCKAAVAAKKKLQNQLTKADSALKGANYVENYFFILNRIISSCCLVERVKVLYEKILERKQELLGKMILKEYIKTHPGAEHKAGVERGGTFVVLYYSSLKPKVSNNLRLPLTAERSILSTTGFSRMPLSFESPRPSVPIGLSGGPIIEGIREFPDFGLVNIPEINIPEIFRPGTKLPFNVAHRTVIGDLCLPYICCTDTPATTFVYPDQEVNLFIGKDHVCVPFEGSGDQLLLEVRPVDATVTAHIGENEIAEVIIKKDNGFFFDPNKVSEEDLGKSISFKVNGQNVDEQLKVLRKPDASFTIAEEVQFRNDNTAAVIKINNTSKLIVGQSFKWEFGQGENITQNATEFTHTYKVKPGGTFTFKVVLKAENESCTDSASQIKVFSVPLSGEEPENCLKNTAAKIENGRLAIQVDLEKNPAELKEANIFYKTEFEPLYKLIFSDLEEALKGTQDNKIFNLIQEIQKQITERLTINRSGKEQEFLLRLYYENLLIYFLVQACRDANISSRTSITGEWVSFTKNAADSFKEALLSLLRNYPVHLKIEDIRTQEDGRLSNPLKKILNDVLEILKQFGA
ncbi:MAG: PKD domain-containing protein [Flavobacteriaceae bacterium]